MKTDLGVVKVGEDNKAEVNLPTKDEDIDREYDRVLDILKQPRKEAKQKRDASTKQEDYYKSFRTRVVLVWLISNLALIIGILHADNGAVGISVTGSVTVANIYLSVRIYSSIYFANGSLMERCWIGSVPVCRGYIIFDFQTYPRRVKKKRLAML